MKHINWKVRINNKTFWVAAVPVMLLIAQAVLKLFGVTFEVDTITAQLVNIINLVFEFLALLGVVVDPTTKGIKDSKQALKYTVPKDEYIRPNKRK